MRAKYSLGKMIRETGLGIKIIIELEKRGSYKCKDIAHKEPLSRHRNVMSLYDQVKIYIKIPSFTDSTFITSSSSVIGAVTIG